MRSKRVNGKHRVGGKYRIDFACSALCMQGIEAFGGGGKALACHIGRWY